GLRPKRPADNLGGGAAGVNQSVLAEAGRHELRTIFRRQPSRHTRCPHRMWRRRGVLRKFAAHRDDADASAGRARHAAAAVDTGGRGPGAGARAWSEARARTHADADARTEPQPLVETAGRVLVTGRELAAPVDTCGPASRRSGHDARHRPQPYG